MEHMELFHWKRSAATRCNGLSGNAESVPAWLATPTKLFTSGASPGVICPGLPQCPEAQEHGQHSAACGLVDHMLMRKMRMSLTVGRLCLSDSVTQMGNVGVDPDPVFCPVLLFQLHQTDLLAGPTTVAVSFFHALVFIYCGHNWYFSTSFPAFLSFLKVLFSFSGCFSVLIHCCKMLFPPEASFSVL